MPPRSITSASKAVSTVCRPVDPNRAVACLTTAATDTGSLSASGHSAPSASPRTRSRGARTACPAASARRIPDRLAAHGGERRRALVTDELLRVVRHRHEEARLVCDLCGERLGFLSRQRTPSDSNLCCRPEPLAGGIRVSQQHEHVPRLRDQSATYLDGPTLRRVRLRARLAVDARVGHLSATRGPTTSLASPRVIDGGTSGPGLRRL